MRFEQLCRTSLPTFNEDKIIDYIKNMNYSNRKKAYMFSDKKSLILAENNIDNYQLSAMLIKYYIFN